MNLNNQTPAVPTVPISPSYGGWTVIEPVVQTSVHLVNSWGNERWSPTQQWAVGLSEVGAGLWLRRNPRPWVQETGIGFLVGGLVQCATLVLTGLLRSA